MFDFQEWLMESALFLYIAEFPQRSADCAVYKYVCGQYHKEILTGNKKWQTVAVALKRFYRHLASFLGI